MKLIEKLRIKASTFVFAVAVVAGMGSMNSCVEELSVGNRFLDKQPGVDVTIDTIFVKGENAKRFLWHIYGAMHNPFT